MFDSRNKEKNGCIYQVITSDSLVELIEKIRRKDAAFKISVTNVRSTVSTISVNAKGEYNATINVHLEDA